MTCTNVDNVKEKVGKHCSIRWTSMSGAERALYQVRADNAAWLALTSAVPIVAVPAVASADTTEEDDDTGSDSEEE